MNRTSCRGWFFVVSASLAISCGDDFSLSSTEPSRNGAASQTGAIIVGQVSSAPTPVPSRGTTASSPTGTFTTADAASITVRVVGTNISTTTNGQGQFTLTGVPPGDVWLEFTGPGGRASLSLSAVRVDEEIRISVTLNGTNARIDSERRNRRIVNGQDQPRLEGTVSGLT